MQETLLRWSGFYVVIILASAGLVQSTSEKPFVPLVQREDLCISSELRKDILNACNQYLEKEGTKSNMPKVPLAPCHSKDIPLSEIAPKVVGQLYGEIENIKGDLLKEYVQKLENNEEYAKAQLKSIKEHYHLDADSFMNPEDLQLEFADMGFKCLPMARDIMELVMKNADTEWLRIDPQHAPHVFVEEDRSKATSENMVLCKMYSAEHEHGCIPHYDFVSVRTNKQNIPAVLSISISEPEDDGDALRYEKDPYSGGQKPSGEMVPLKRQPGQMTLIPPGVGHDVVSPKSGKRISLIVLCELMHPVGHEKFLEDKKVQNVPFLLRKLVKDIAGRAADKSENMTLEALMREFLDGCLMNAAKALTTPKETNKAADGIPEKDDVPEQNQGEAPSEKVSSDEPLGNPNEPCGIQ